MHTRQIFIDTETTGISARQGHRIIELAAVEAVDGCLTGQHFHTYLDPGRAIDPGAQRVHGIHREFLQGKPRFEDMAEAFLDFVRGAEFLMHNAPFDRSFIDAELSRAGRTCSLRELGTVTCTVQLARRRYPGEGASLDALIRRAGLGVLRQQHSALEDAQLLAQVYFKTLGPLARA